MVFTVLTVALTVFYPATLTAADGKQRLDSFFSELKSMRAHFVQTVIDGNGDVIEESRGTMALLRPGRFNWHYLAPFEQRIVTDGKRLWIYDPDLDQVSIKPFDEGLGETPALLLSGDTKVYERFDVRPLEISGSEFEWLLLTPKEQQSGYESVQLGFDQAGLRIVRFSDDFGHHTQIQFQDIEANVSLAKDEFEFVAPAGVEVISDPALF